MAFITVSDAAGRVLFRRRATEAEIEEAQRAADLANEGAESAMHEIAEQRYAALATGGTIEQQLEPPPGDDVEHALGKGDGFGEEDGEMLPELEEGQLFAADEDEVPLDESLDPWFDDARYRHEEPNT
jgi:hypothetical protein